MSANITERGSFEKEMPTMFTQNLYEESNVALAPLGAVRTLSDGREFVYCHVSNAANLAAGALAQSPVCDVANLGNLAITANANIGAKEVSITLGDTTAANTANALAGGILHINTGAGNGCAYRIESHAAIAANANGNIALSDKLRANIAAATSKASLYPDPYKNVIVHPSPPTGKLVGVATFPVTKNYYAWLQRKGPCALENEAGSGAALAPGEEAYASPASDGCITGQVSNANAIVAMTTFKFPVGKVMANNANDHWALVDLNL